MRITVAAWTMAAIMATASISVAQPQGPDTLWTRDYPELMSLAPWAVMTTPDRGLALAGIGGTYENYDGELVKFDSVGNVVWTRQFGLDTTNEYVWDGICTRDGGFFLVGYSTQSQSTNVIGMLAMKFDSLGDTLWTSPLVLEDEVPIARVTLEARNGSLVIAGQLHGAPTLIWLDPEGHLIRYGSYYPFGLWGLRIADIAETASGCLVVVGQIWTVDSSGLNIYAGGICVDSLGDTLWARMYEYPPGVRKMVFFGVSSLGFDSIMISGSVLTGDTAHLALFMADGGGSLVWHQNYDVPNMFGSTVLEQQIVREGNSDFVIGATFGTPSDLWSRGVLFKVDNEGQSQWRRIYEQPNRDHLSRALQVVPGNGLVWVLSDDNEPIMPTVVRLAREQEDVSGNPSPIRREFVLRDAYPNPFNSTTHLAFTLPTTQRVSLRLYDLLGREVAVMMNEIQTAGRHKMTFDASGLPSGVYLCRLEAGGMAQTRKVVLIK